MVRQRDTPTRPITSLAPLIRQERSPWYPSGVASQCPEISSSPRFQAGASSAGYVHSLIAPMPGRLLKVESDIDTAIAFAHEFALHGRGHAWVCEGFGKVRAI
jgi:hypothetical protein